MNNTVVGLETPSPILDSYEAYGCRVNSIDPRELFRRYETAGFLYPAKLTQLAPYWSEIQRTWGQALKATDRLLWFITHDECDGWATVSSWRSTTFGWQSQHVVSSGSPSSSRAVLLAGAAVRLVRSELGDDLSQENWFRPDNRFANKVFGSLMTTIGTEHSSVGTYNYLQVKATGFRIPSSHVRIVACTSDSSEQLLAIARATRGEVFAVAEELDQDDLLLDGVDHLYQQVGLRRYRRIWLAFQGLSDTPCGAIIAWRGPLGLNFSFLENRCDLMIHPEVRDEELRDIVHQLIHVASSTYQDFAPGVLFVVADDRTASCLRNAGAELIRRYSQSIWLKEGYVGWYRHVERFYARISRSHHRRGIGGGSPPK